jgi:uncharacterized protein YaaW (UPF0174 family)
MVHPRFVPADSPYRAMQDVLAPLTLADYTFLIGLLKSDVNFVDNHRLNTRLIAVEHDDTPDNRRALERQIERELRYLGSADLAYAFRYVTGQPPGVPFREVVLDAAKVLKVDLSPLGTDRELVERLVEDYATQQFASLSPKQQREMLEDLGVEQERAAAFIKKSAGVFAVPALIKAFGVVVVDGLIKTVVFGTIAKIIGRQLANRLFQMLVARFPWWVRWIGPVAWSASIGWAVLDIQGPAYRKTVPAVLYLGLCSLRERHG